MLFNLPLRTARAHDLLAVALSFATASHEEEIMGYSCTIHKITLATGQTRSWNRIGTIVTSL